MTAFIGVVGASLSVVIGCGLILGLPNIPQIDLLLIVSGVASLSATFTDAMRE